MELNKRLLYKFKDVSVYLVDGKAVKPKYDMDFVEGGHGYIYSYIPKDEVWIDDQVDADERDYVVLHELYERQRMKALYETYGIAHSKANKFEKSFRVGKRRLPKAKAQKVKIMTTLCGMR